MIFKKKRKKRVILVSLCEISTTNKHTVRTKRKVIMEMKVKRCLRE